jgi:hypothetical protein
MKHLLGIEKLGNRIARDWLHWGEDGRKKITTEITEDVAPVFEQVKAVAQTQTRKGMLRLKCSIPFTVMEDAAKVNGAHWGISTADAYREIVQQKTDRAKQALKLLAESRDYNKFHAKTYR